MALHDVRKVYVVQDRATGAFVDENMTFVSMLRHAVRVEDPSTIWESMQCAIYDGHIDCPDGYEVIPFFEENT